VHRIVTDLAALVDPGLVGWIDEHVSFVTTMVDRITPRTTDADVAEAGDPLAVVTEPFSEWVLSGEFPAGRPAWDARFVDDVRPFETRKLWLLNGAHSIIAYAGSIRGHLTVADAIADPVVAGWVEEWWDAAARHLTLPADEIAAYRAALLDRFSNPQIRHLLAQIAADGSQKVRIRAVPVLLAERKAGSLPAGVTRMIAAWIAHLRGHGVAVTDAQAGEVLELATGRVADVLAWLGIEDVEVTALVEQQVGELTR
jgi:fructuronate reductase